MTLPKALFIGPMKTGTTWVYEYLRDHGQIILPDGVKETFYFDRNYKKGPKWYAKHFSTSSISELPLEVAPSYFHCKEAPGRIHDTLGKVPLIVTLRDPVKRSWSHYLHLLRYGYTDAPLITAVEMFPPVLEASFYSEMLTRWEAVFEKSDIHVLWQEELQENPLGYIEKICNILQISKANSLEQLPPKVNEASSPPSSKLAALGRRISSTLRANGLYGPVNLAKNLGLKKFFFGKPGVGKLPQMSIEDEKWLAERLADDYAKLSASIRHPLVVSPETRLSGGCG